MWISPTFSSKKVNGYFQQDLNCFTRKKGKKKFQKNRQPFNDKDVYLDIPF